MSAVEMVAISVGAVVGAAGALLWISPAVGGAPARLIRTNVQGKSVAAVLGLPLAMGALLAVFVVHALALGEIPSALRVRLGLALLAVIGGAGVAGLADDLRGDEEERGFVGHLRAARSGRLTGGIVKIAVIGTAGAVAGFLVGGGWFVVEAVLLVGLGANLINLLDRAPGRAGKVALIGAAALVAFGAAEWAVLSAGLWGALAVVLRADLKQRAMLGDAGANPLGGVLGFGLALSLGEAGRVVAIGILAAANVASERWSFSSLIERTSWLRAFDRIGR